MHAPALLILCTIAAAADNGQQAFEQLFGEQVQSVMRTRDPADDIELAKKLLDTAGELSAEEALVPHLYENACELAGKSVDGFETARTAMQQLAERYPDRRAQAEARIRELVEQAYNRARGDDRARIGEELVELLDREGLAQVEAGEYQPAIATYRLASRIARSIRSAVEPFIQARLEWATELVRVQRQVAVLARKLEATPDDTQTADALVLAHVVKFDKSRDAARYAPLASDEIRQNTALAVQDLEATDADASATLGQWYAELAKPERGLIKQAMLEHAESYLTRHLDLTASAQGGKSVETLKAELALKQVQQELEKLREANGAKGRWVDLTQAFAKVVTEKAWQGEGGEAEFTNGVLRLFGQGKGTVYLNAPVNAQDVVFSVEVKKLKGLYVQISARTGDTGDYHVTMELYDTLTLRRWLKSGGGVSDLASATAKDAFGGEFAEVQLAVLGDTVLLFVNGKRVMKAQDARIAGKGGVNLGVRNADAEFRRPRFMTPTPKQVKELLAGGG